MLMWIEHEFDKAARVAAEMGLRDYVEKLEAIAELTRRAAVEKAIEGKNHTINVSVAHVEKQAIFTAKYGNEETRVSLSVEEMGRYALLANLATMVVPDLRVKGLKYITRSHMRAADRLLMLGVLMPGEYALNVRRIYVGSTGLSPIIEVRSGIRKIIKSPIHRLAFDAAWEMGLPSDDHILAVAWLFISAVLNAPDGGRPSEGFVELAKRLAAKSGRPEEVYKTALEPLRPYVEGLDKVLGSISRGDKAFLIGKMVDYKGHMIENRAVVRIRNINNMAIRANDIEIHMVDVAAAAVNAFGERNTLRTNGALALLGIPPIGGPAIKAAAALRARERRINDLLKYGEPIKIGDVEIVPVEAEEVVVEITSENLNEVMKGFKEGYYTHLRLTNGRERYDILYNLKLIKAKSRFIASAKGGLVAMVEKVGIRPSKKGVIMFTINRLPALLSAGIKAYAVRKAKRGEAAWIVRIGDIELKMFRNARGHLSRQNDDGKIPAFISGKLDLLDLRKLAEGCEDCPERRVAVALNAAGVRWSVSPDAKYLVIYPPRR